MDKAQREIIRSRLIGLPGGAFSPEPVEIARNDLRRLLNALDDLEDAAEAYRNRIASAIDLLGGTS